MKLETLRDLMIEQMQDVYDAENQLIEALPKMADAATSRQLKKAFTDHLKQTQGHAQRLEQVFKLLDEKAQRKTCKAMQGLVKEGDEAIKEKADTDVKDAGLIAAAQRVEHYEIAAYGTLRAYARQAGLDQAAQIFDQTLQEEGEADKLLTQIAEGSINVKATQ
jgi:ferritin-like metal-binding protein YciE